MTITLALLRSLVRRSARACAAASAAGLPALLARIWPVALAEQAGAERAEAASRSGASVNSGGGGGGGSSSSSSTFTSLGIGATSPASTILNSGASDAGNSVAGAGGEGGGSSGGRSCPLMTELLSLIVNFVSGDSLTHPSFEGAKRSLLLSDRHASPSALHHADLGRGGQSLLHRLMSLALAARHLSTSVLSFRALGALALHGECRATMLKCGFAGTALARLARLLLRREPSAPRVASVLALVGNLSFTADGQTALLRVKLDGRGEPLGVSGGAGGRGTAHLSAAHYASDNASAAARGVGAGADGSRSPRGRHAAGVPTGDHSALQSSGGRVGRAHPFLELCVESIERLWSHGGLLVSSAVLALRNVALNPALSRPHFAAAAAAAVQRGAEVSATGGGDVGVGGGGSGGSAWAALPALSLDCCLHPDAAVARVAASLLWALAFHDPAVRGELRGPASALEHVQQVIAGELASRAAQDEGAGWAQLPLSPAARSALAETAATLRVVHKVVIGEAPSSPPVRPSRLFSAAGRDTRTERKLSKEWV